MMFKADMLEKVLAGTKTVTRRPLSDKPRSPWWKDGCSLKVGHHYALVPGRGKDQVGRVLITEVRKERWADITEEGAFAEGFVSRQLFLDRIREMYPGVDIYDECWVIEFELISVTAVALRAGADLGGDRLLVLAPTVEQANIVIGWWRHAQPDRHLGQTFHGAVARHLQGFRIDESTRIVQIGSDDLIPDRGTKVETLRRAALKRKGATAPQIIRVTEGQ